MSDCPFLPTKTQKCAQIHVTLKLFFLLKKNNKMKKIGAEEFRQLRHIKNSKPTWTGWRYAALITGLIGAVTLTLYPIAIEPILNPEKYKEIQKQTRAGKIFTDLSCSK